jgi:uncharacterized SAM-binding protein YcdF (DUF218 family)
MFLYLSKVLPWLLYPPGLTLWLLLAAAALRKRLPKFATTLFVVAIVTLYALSTGMLSGTLQRRLESAYPALSIDALQKADAVVVLGGYLHSPGGQHAAAELMDASDRLRVAAQIFRANKAPIVLLTGGNVPMFSDTAIPEAQAARDVLHEWGVPFEAILVEDRSRNTRENAVFSAPVLRAKGAHGLILVTSASHMQRAVAVFRRAGLDVVPFPTDYQTGWGKPDWLLQWVPDADALGSSNRALREWIGLAAYRLRGWA